MHYFKHKKGELYAEGVPLRVLAEKYGTPLYVYSAATLERHIGAYERAFRGVPHVTCFAVKANSNTSVLGLLGRHGAGADVVSGGELERALRAGIPASKIVYAGVGKTEPEIRAALKAGIMMFNIESVQELEAIADVARRMRTRAPIALRVNPDVDPGTHPYISTGLKKYKFGVPMEAALEFYAQAARTKGIEIVGVHKHIGSQITQVTPFVDALKRVLTLVDALAAEGLAIRNLDIGGGLGIPYDGARVPEPRHLAREILPLIKGRGLTLVAEPGRSIVGNAGVLVTRVLYTKPGPGKTFLVVDGAMNDLMRPAMYDAYHEVQQVRKTRRAPEVADVVGPICESGDFLARERTMPRTLQGELLAVMSAGAYGFSMSSNYNSRPRAAEVMVKGTRHWVVRARETFDDLVRGETPPPAALLK
jgi:diaminopimelate decarboxylase